jgi:hypothetical protein
MHSTPDCLTVLVPLFQKMAHHSNSKISGMDIWAIYEKVKKVT